MAGVLLLSPGTTLFQLRRQLASELGLEGRNTTLSRLAGSPNPVAPSHPSEPVPLAATTSPYLPISPHISPYLPISPHVP